MPTAPSLPAFARHVVSAVLVAHDGAAWLPRTLAALAAQTRPPDVVVAVDTGSEDDSAALLADYVGSVVGAGRRTGFGDAVRLGLGTLDSTLDPATTRGQDVVEWVWLLHDDSAPEPEALAHLLAFVDSSPDVGVAGPKLLGWNDPRLLLEVGVTTARGGRRETGLERRERDQGQHDGIHDVLAVSTAGMLVRRDVWDQLGGLDPVLPLYRDDVDLGWRANLAGHRVVCVTDAVVHHAEAASHGRRPVAATGRFHRADRRHALFVLLANQPLLTLPWALLRLTVGSLLRAVLLLLGKLPAEAADELLAVGAVLARPDRLVRARVARRRTRRVPARATRHLLASAASSARHAMEALGVLLGTPAAQALTAGRHRVVETGPAAEEAEDMPAWGTGLLRRVVTKPPVALVLALSVLALVAARGLVGEGRLLGGALLPAPDSAAELWRTYIAGWHPVGVGSDTAAPPYLAVVAALGTVLVGNATLAVDLLLLAAVPLSGLTAYLAVRTVIAPVRLRIWVAATYALLPAVTGAVATGRLGTAGAAVLLPPTALAAVRAIGSADRPGSGRAAWAAGLALAALTAFAPVAYPVALVLAVAAVPLVVRRRAWRRLAVVLAVPPALLLPWLPALVADPQLLLLEGGFPGPGLSDPRLPPVAVVLLHPGGPGMYPAVLSVGLVLAGFAALLRTNRRGLIGAGWVAAIVGLGAGLLMSRVQVTAPTLETSVAAWPGFPTLLAGAGLLLAAAVGAQGAGRRISRSSFGWRQPTALAIAALAAVTPLLAGAWWVVDGAGDPLVRRDPTLLPAFVAAEGNQAERPRTLVLRPREDGRISYALLRADGPRLGDAETAPPVDADGGLDGVVADLASGRGGDAAAQLLPYGVRFVLMGRPVDRDLARAVDGSPGLVRVSGPEGSVIWRVDYPSGRLRVVPGGAAADVVEAAAGSTVLPGGAVGADSVVGAGDPGRLLAVADRRDDGWRASVDGQALAARAYDGWAQAFSLPPGGGRLELRYDDGPRQALLWLQAALVVAVVLLALPGARREADPDLPPDRARRGPEPATEPITRRQAERTGSRG